MQKKTSRLADNLEISYGAINSLFSGFAFAGVIITLVLQRRDLEATRNAMGQERIDSTFFQLLQLHTDITSKLKISGGPSGIEALVAYDEHLKNADDDFVVFQALQKIDDGAVRTIRDRRAVAAGVFPELTASDVANLNNSLATGISSFDNYLDQNLTFHERKIVAAYTSVAAQHIDSFSHYFRNLYNIFKFIDESKLVSENDKKTYAKFVRSQLSDIELVCLFYNSISKIDLPGRAGMELGYPKMYAYLKNTTFSRI